MNPQCSFIFPLMPFSFSSDNMFVVHNVHNVSCYLNGVCFNHLFYADNSVILAPSAAALQKLLDKCCEFAMDKDIVYNIKKTKCMTFLPRWLCDLKEHVFYTDGKPLANITEHVYVGIPLCNNFKDDLAIKNNARAICQGQYDN